MEFDDRLSVYGALLGGLVVLAGLGTLSGTPWSSGALGVVQTVGALLAVGVGAGLAYLAVGV